MSDETTPRLGLPLLRPGQAQKEWWHNEALALVDMAMQPSVVAANTQTPPADPTPGACWLLGVAPTGPWAGEAGSVACWTAGGWRFVRPREGMAVWSVADAQTLRFAGGSWRGSPAIPAAAGGSVVDSEARAAIGSVLGALRDHGIIAMG